MEMPGIMHYDMQYDAFYVHKYAHVCRRLLLVLSIMRIWLPFSKMCIIVCVPPFLDGGSPRQHANAIAVNAV